MIIVKAVGHIRRSLGAETVELDERGIGAVDLIERLRERAREGPDVGFTRFNTLIVVNGGQAFIPAAEDRKLKDGDEVLLLPISHGG